MLPLPFEKWHGLGNDFVVVQAEDWRAASGDEDLVRATCHRKFGVGSDGLITLEPGGPGEAVMVMFNPDGSRSGMCGNGIRCAALYCSSRGWIQGRSVIHTDSRPVVIEIDSPGMVSVDMGAPSFDPSEVGIASPEEWVIREVEGHIGTAVSMGNPHFVCFVDDPSRIDLEKIGPDLENHPFFLHRTNVHFASLVSPGHLSMRTWERGAGITLACGSGACAVFASAQRLAMVQDSALVSLPGGDLQLRNESGRIFMTGPAVMVFSGSWLT